MSGPAAITLGPERAGQRGQDSLPVLGAAVGQAVRLDRDQPRQVPRPIIRLDPGGNRLRHRPDRPMAEGVAPPSGS